MKSVFTALVLVVGLSNLGQAQQSPNIVVHGAVASEIAADLQAAGISKFQGVDETNYTAQNIICRHIVVTRKDNCVLNDRTDSNFTLQNRNASELTALLESSGISHRIFVDVDAIQAKLISCTSNIVTGFQMQCLIQPN